MKLVKDLGMREYGNQGYKYRYGLYECPVCNEHFECSTPHVKSGNTTKCRSCANKATTNDIAAKAASEFIEKARAIHGNLYEYLLDDYMNSYTKIKIICPVHGIFEQTPNNHLRGKGCPHCAFERSNIAMRMSEKNDRPTTLYYIYFPEVNLWKIGCTTQTLEERFSQDKLQYVILQTKEYTSGNEAYRVEKFILDTTKEFQYKGKILSSGNTELRVQGMDNIVQSVISYEYAK